MTVLEAGPVRLDVEGYQAIVDATTIELSRLQRDVLKVLAEHPGELVTYEQLAMAGWGRARPDRRPICNAVHTLRTLLAAAHAPSRIRAVASMGYVFDPDPGVASPRPVARHARYGPALDQSRSETWSHRVRAS